MITDATIKSALAGAVKSGKSTIELKDGDRRGDGRLALIIRIGEIKPPAVSAPVSSNWFAVWYNGSRRKMAKIGVYPTMSLAEARRRFKADFVPAISRGENPEGALSRRPSAAGRTVRDLFTAYVAHLEAGGKESRGPKAYLLGTKNPATGRWNGRATQSAADAIGGDRPACEITPADIKPHLARIHKRGSVGAASHARAYISAAFMFGMKSANAYHQAAGEVNWGIIVNPVAAIPFDPAAKRVGTRHLTPAEFRHFWFWLVEAAERSAAAAPLQLCMTSGARLTEMLCLTPNATAYEAYADQGVRLGLYDAGEKLIDWGKTKAAKGANLRPHTLPVTHHAVAVLKKCITSKSGLYFSQRRDSTKVLTIGAAEQLVDEYLKKNPTVPRFTPRDIRRTWKTLSGAAGISKEARDRLQNHSMADVSSRHYDRYDYLAEKRAAVKAWERYMDRILAGELDTPVATLRGRA